MRIIVKPIDLITGGFSIEYRGPGNIVVTRAKEESMNFSTCANNELDLISTFANFPANINSKSNGMKSFEAGRNYQFLLMRYDVPFKVDYSYGFGDQKFGDQK